MRKLTMVILSHSFWGHLFTSYQWFIEFLEINTDNFYHLAASNTQIIRSSTKKESETGGSKKKGHISSSKDIKTSFKPGLVQEGPPVLDDKSLLLENFQNNDRSPQQVRYYRSLGFREKK